MKRVLIALLCLTALIIGFIGGRYDPLEKAMESYCEITQGDMPEDIRLTIYGRSFWDKSDAPISKEDVMAEQDILVTVGPEALKPYWQEFRSLKPAILEVASEKEANIRARVCILLDVGDGAGNYETILELIQDDPDGHILINGVEVEDSEFLHELILLFITDDERYFLYV